MVFRTLSVIALLFISSGLFSQSSKDTVWTTVDYSRAQRPASQEERSPQTVNHYISLQANQLLRQLLNLSGSNTSINNPYTATYSFNGKAKGNGMNFGLGVLSEKISNNNVGIKSETSSSDLFFRVGYDKKIQLSQRWIWGWGIDGLILRSKRNTTITQGVVSSIINSSTNGLGIGPRLSLLFNISKMVFLGTEASCYYQSSKTKREIKSNSNPTENSDSKNSTFALQVPVVLYLIVKF